MRHLMLSRYIYAIKHRDVAMVDISGAFMQADAIATPWENG